MFVEVYNDNEKVFAGTLEQFLADNGNDEYLFDLTKKLYEQDSVSFVEHSGKWKIYKV